jgi:hypothetical protein
MCSKGVWQLEELTVRFCNRAKGSSGARCVARGNGALRDAWEPTIRPRRAFMLEHMAGFAKENPHLMVKATHKPNRSALLVGKYGESTRRRGAWSRPRRSSRSWRRDPTDGSQQHVG